jgi:uncharacterized membrane protein YccC
VFERNPAGLNWPRAVLFLDVALVPLVVFWAIGHEEYLLSALFGAMFAWLSDPGGGYGKNLSHGYWMPIAAMSAMQPSLEQSTLIAAQRVSGTLIGAVAAALLLLIPASEHGLRLFAVDRGLEVVALVLLMHGVAIRFWNYALYTGAIAAGVLTLIDLPQPSNYAAEGYRLLWTLCGVGIGVLVMLLAGLLARRTAKALPQQATQPA